MPSRSGVSTLKVVSCQPMWGRRLSVTLLRGRTSPLDPAQAVVEAVLVAAFQDDLHAQANAQKEFAPLEHLLG